MVTPREELGELGEEIVPRDHGYVDVNVCELLREALVPPSAVRLMNSKIRLLSASTVLFPSSRVTRMPLTRRPIGKLSSRFIFAKADSPGRPMSDKR